MSYNWQSAATPQGRERLKELIEDGHQIATRRTVEGRYKHIITHSDLNPHSGDLVIDNDVYEDWEDAEGNNTFDDLEFLDPEPPAPVVDEPVKMHLKNYLWLLMSINDFPSNVSRFDDNGAIDKLKALIGDDWQLPSVPSPFEGGTEQ